MIDFNDKKVAVLGAGVSGVYSARLLTVLGAEVLLSDTQQKDDLKECKDIPGKVELEFGEHSRKVLQSDLIVLSPGIACDIPVLQEAAAKGIKVIGELELACRYIDTPMIAVTGTNGKTTTTTLISEILKADGRNVFVAGNIGEPLTKFAKPVYGEPADIGVVEVSSFQLETIEEFRPHVAMVLNITPDHLDRYKSFPDYLQAKARIFMNQGSRDFAVLNADCPSTISLKSAIRSQVLVYSKTHEQTRGVFVNEGKIINRIDTEKDEVVCNVSGIKLKGVHNLENILSAVCAAAAVGVKKDVLSSVLGNFPGLEHRLEFVREISGVEFINDSKGTNVDAVLRALESVGSDTARSVILIIGGRNKGGDFGLLGPEIEKKVKKIVLIGEAGSQIKDMFLNYSGTLESIMREAKDMKEAVETAYENAGKGDTVLLSPGCSSFDMFENYKHRGRVFKTEVLKLK